MIKLSFKEFLKTGRIELLRKGITRDRVHGMLGIPHDWDSDSAGWENAKIWKYHDIQLFFSDNILTYIGIYPGGSVNLPENINLIGIFPNKNSSFDKIQHFLDNERLNYKVDTQYGPKIIVENTVEIDFYDEDNLYSIGTIFP